MVNARDRFSVRVWFRVRVRGGAYSRASVILRLGLGLGLRLVLGLGLGLR